MFGTLGTIMLIVTLLLGGTGVTVAAAQSSQPDDLLYNVKLLSENTLLDLTSKPESQFDLALEYADRRGVEIITIYQTGEVPAEEVQTRYQEHIEQAIQLALTLSDDQIMKAFERIQTQLQYKEQAFLQLQTNGSPNIEAALTQTREMVQERLQILATGESNLLQIQNQLQQQNQINNPDQQSTNAASGQNSTNSPGTGNGNPWMTGTLTPGSGSGSENGSIDGNPWTTGTPEPGSSYGPGTGECTTCTPQTRYTTKTVTPVSGNGNGGPGGKP